MASISQFIEWYLQFNYLISLSIDNEENIQDLYYKLRYFGVDVVTFYEPDIDNQMTAICLYDTPDMQKYTKK